MPHRLEITLKPDLFDPEGQGICKKAEDYFSIKIESIRTVHIITIDAELSQNQLKTIQNKIFTNPVTQISSYSPLDILFDWSIWVGYRPGVKDNPGSTAVEAIEDLLDIKFDTGKAVYTSKRYCLRGKGLTYKHVKKIADQLLANDIIQQWKIYDVNSWEPARGIGFILPKVILHHNPTLSTIPVKTDAQLQAISRQRNLALNPADIPVIRSYFLDKKVQADRALFGLSDPTDLEMEYISQARSDHCNHNTFQGLFYYHDLETRQVKTIDNLFNTCIKTPTLELKDEKEWVKSVLWDNAGVGRFDDENLYVITGETHNSPSNMEAYGGAITGIVGIYRDPMGTGKGAKLIMGSYGFCVGPHDYNGDLKPRLHPRRLLDGIIEGVRDGGNKSGIPTMFGQTLFNSGYIGKCLVFVTAIGTMPSQIQNKPAYKKSISPDDLVVMCGGRVGKDGIHGVTASSETFSQNTPAGHVQIGDPYTQKKMHDFLLEARDLGLIEFITDNGGGGLSSSVGETARFSNGCRIFLEKVPLKYQGLDQWEIWVSESQERMTVAVSPSNINTFLQLSQKHAVESTVIGKYTDSGKLHITYNNKTCAYIDMDFLTTKFPQWEFEADWSPPQLRGFHEPVIGAPDDYKRLLLDILSRPNICSKQSITRQYDHEVQGTSVIKPLVGAQRDMNSDAVVFRPVLDSTKGLAFAQALIPQYSAIDTYHMTTCTIDEAVRRLIAVGANPEHIGGVDNFCWPDIQFHPEQNPDGKLKAARLVRSCTALRDLCLAYKIPLLSGKDSMYVDGHIPGKYGQTHKISAPESLQFSAISVVDDITGCITMDSKTPEHLVYVLGTTRNELGGSEYYEHLGYIGLNIPRVFPDRFMQLYKALSNSISQKLVASAHGIYRGGLATHLAMVAIGGNLGMRIDLKKAPAEHADQNQTLLFSESAGRFIVTIDPKSQSHFETLFKGLSFACIGATTQKTELLITGLEENVIVSASVQEMRAAWNGAFGEAYFTD
jgi:phosphoribosylformylglycinamidine synthase subunit PurSL